MNTIKETYQELSRQDQGYLDVAIALAKTSKCRKRHGAVLVFGGSVISTGVNRQRNDPHNLSPMDIPVGASVHAEHDALRRFTRWNPPPRHAVMYVARVNMRDEIRLSRPCNRCWETLSNYVIKEVVYTT